MYYFEFGKNFSPEMSYSHMGLIIGVKSETLHVLPICSYKPGKAQHRQAFHPVKNPDSKSDLYILENSVHSFLKHDSVLSLNDIKTISKNRKMSGLIGAIDVNSETYAIIEDLVIEKYFKGFHFQSRKLKEKCAELERRLVMLGHEYRG